MRKELNNYDKDTDTETNSLGLMRSVNKKCSCGKEKLLWHTKTSHIFNYEDPMRLDPPQMRLEI